LLSALANRGREPSREQRGNWGTRGIAGRAHLSILVNRPTTHFPLPATRSFLKVDISKKGTDRAQAVYVTRGALPPPGQPSEVPRHPTPTNVSDRLGPPFQSLRRPTLVAALSAAPPGQWERILNQSKLGHPPPSAPKAQRCVFTARLRLWSTRKEEQVLAAHLDLPVNIPRGSHPFPSRTRKLSLAGPMVLHA
jgi:hypothetical protein